MNRLCAALEAAGLPLWRDVRDGPLGEDVNDMLAEAVDEAGAVLTLWSPAAIASDWVRAEAERARRQNKLVPAQLAAAEPPLVFSGLNTVDLTAWTGVRGDAEFQRLTRALRYRLGAEGAQVEAVERDGRFGLAARPVHLRPPEDDEARRARALRVQAELAQDLANEIAFEDEENLSNPDKRQIRRLTIYRDALLADEPLWETIDQRYGRLAPVLEDEAADKGLQDTAERLAKGHMDLERRLRPDQPEDAVEPEDSVDPPTAAEAIPELRAIRNELPENRFAPEIADFLDDQASQIEQEQTEGPDAPTEAAEEASRSRAGRALRAALGVVGSLASALTIHSWVLSPEGQAALSVLARAFETLMRLL